MAIAVIIVGSIFIILLILLYTLFSSNKKYEPQRKPIISEKKHEEKNYFPERYGKDQIVVMVRDPEWLHAYWEVTATKQSEFTKQFGDIWEESSPVLRVYDITHSKSEDNYFDIHINNHANNWYIHVGKPNHTFFVDLGRILPDGRFYRIARSNCVTTPSNSISQEIDPNWVPVEAIWKTFYSQGFEESFSSLELFSERSD
ncbi:MAG: hypothetical protein XD50_1391 [Clostridia bacterium 41_269]|nr:MAG: hypothetical protein XD50_1391 [Clostridia bacterium 41_269]